MALESYEFMKEPRMQDLVASGLKAVENQTNLVEAATRAALAFERLVTVIEKLAEREMKAGE